MQHHVWLTLAMICPKPAHWVQLLLAYALYGSTLVYHQLWYWHQRADQRHGNPPQGNQELLVVRDKVGRPQVSLG